METQELHRGRLIDHIQLVVRDISASQIFMPPFLQRSMYRWVALVTATSGQTNYS
jgi:hypothetical protein